MGIFNSLLPSETDGDGPFKERIRRKLTSFLKSVYNAVKGLFLKTKKFLSSHKNPTETRNDFPSDDHYRPAITDRESAVYSFAPSKHVIITVPELEYSLDCTSVSDDQDDPYSVDSATVYVEDDDEISTEDVDDEDDDGGDDEEEREVIKNVMLEISRANTTTHHDDHDFIINEERWIKHYSNHQRILLVGEGDFSFSSCLAMAFGIASNMIATSLDSEDFLKKHYQNATRNINELRIRGCMVMHEIDATKMADHAILRHLEFDRVIYNFPFAGFFKDISRESQLRRHRRLVSGFLKNAKEMISERGDGEIHITHKTNAFHREWNIVSIASSHGLRLIEEVRFNHYDYPRYRTKCGFGGDNNFNCNPSKTFKFGLV